MFLPLQCVCGVVPTITPSLWERFYCFTHLWGCSYHEIVFVGVFQLLHRVFGGFLPVDCICLGAPTLHCVCVLTITLRHWGCSSCYTKFMRVSIASMGIYLTNFVRSVPTVTLFYSWATACRKNSPISQGLVSSLHFPDIFFVFFEEAT